MKLRLFVLVIFSTLSVYACDQIQLSGVSNNAGRNAQKAEELVRWEEAIAYARQTAYVNIRRVDENTLRLDCNDLKPICEAALNETAEILEVPEIVVKRIYSTDPINTPANASYRNVEITWTLTIDPTGFFGRYDVTVFWELR